MRRSRSLGLAPLLILAGCFAETQTEPASAGDTTIVVSSEPLLGQGRNGLLKRTESSLLRVLFEPLPAYWVACAASTLKRSCVLEALDSLSLGPVLGQ